MIKKLLLAVLAILLTIDLASAQMAFNPQPKTGDNLSTVISPDDNDDLAKKRRRKSSRGRGRGRGSDMGLLVSPSVGVGLPMGDFGDANKLGFGLTIDGLFFIDQLGVGLSTGYHTFGYKEETGFSSGAQSFIPILAEAVYLFSTEDFKPYAGVGLGLYSVKASGDLSVSVPVGINPVTMEIIYETTTQSFSESKSNFGFAPVVGMYLTLNDKMMLTGSARYNMIMSKEEVMVIDLTQPSGYKTEEESVTTSYLTINFGLAFSLGN